MRLCPRPPGGPALCACRVASSCVEAERAPPPLGEPPLTRAGLGRYYTLERDGAVLDAEAAVQYVTRGLCVPASRVLLLGQVLVAPSCLLVLSTCIARAGVKPHDSMCSPSAKTRTLPFPPTCVK